MRARDVARPDARRETVNRVVCLLDQIVFVFERDHRHDGPKNLFLGHAHAVLHFVKNRRRKEVALLQRAFEPRRRATDDDRRTFTPRDIDVPLDAMQLFCGNLRPHLRRLVRRIANHDLSGFLTQLADELIFDRLFDKQARTGTTHLALVVEDAHHRAGHGLLEIGIRKDDVRRFTAEL